MNDSVAWSKERHLEIVMMAKFILLHKQILCLVILLYAIFIYMFEDCPLQYVKCRCIRISKESKKLSSYLYWCADF